MNDPRYQRSTDLLARAERVIPTGSQTFSKSRVQFPAGFAPLFLDRGRGGRVWDVDGHGYVDLVGGLLPVVLGYGDPDVDRAIRDQLERGITFSLATELEIDLAERLVDLIPCAEKVRFGKNGSDATAAAIRLARAWTGRDHVVAIGYHGWQDWYIGATTRDKGVPAAVRALTHKVGYDDLDAVRAVLDRHEVAAVILEPLTAAPAAPAYLAELAELVRRRGAVLVFDEIITGFRAALGGAQGLVGVTPDLACFGKAMANGMPISAVVGRADIMDEMTEIFFSGTFGGETLSLAAAIATIDKMRREPVIDTLTAMGTRMLDVAQAAIADHDLAGVIGFAPGLPSWRPVTFQDAPGAPAAAIHTRWQIEMLAQGVLTGGSHNVCYAHDDADLAGVAAAWRAACARIAEDLAAGALVAHLPVPAIEPVFRVRD